MMDRLNKLNIDLTDTSACFECTLMNFKYIMYYIIHFFINYILKLGRSKMSLEWRFIIFKVM